MNEFLLLLVWWVLPSNSDDDPQYCAMRYRRLCQGKGRHVGCQFPDSGPGPSCEHYAEINFTNDLKHFITHYLNRRRQRIAAGNERVRGGVRLPKPQVMMLVEWDRELSRLAQRLADQCHFVHDDCRATVHYPYAGQTVGEVRWRRSSDSDELSAQRAIRRVLDAWWGERRRVQVQQLTEPFRLTSRGAIWGHFSQLAVWNLQAVGCGAVRHGAHHHRLLLVCDFSHTNMLGQRTLVPGGLAPCPIHTARRLRSAFPLLCGPVQHSGPSDLDNLEPEDNYEDEGSQESEAEDNDQAEVPIWRNRIAYSTPKDHKDFEEKFISSRERQDKEEGEPDLVAIRDWVPRKPIEQPHKDDVVTRQKVVYKDGVRDGIQYQKEPIDIYKKWRQGNLKSDDIPSKVIPLPIDSEEDFEPVFHKQPKSRLKVTKLRLEGPYEDQEISKYIHYRPTVTEDAVYHHRRWKYTRQRPARPGANALYTQTSEKSKKPFLMAVNLDKDDIDQLFRDTGFNLHWRKATT